MLQQQLEMYDAYQQRIVECDQQLQKHLASLVDSRAAIAATVGGKEREEGQTSQECATLRSQPANCSASRE